jgi:phospholipase C
MRLPHAVILAALGLLAVSAGAQPAGAQPAGAQNVPGMSAAVPAELAKIGHVVVIFEENRSFDSLFGEFPGADGLANAGAAATQLDREGRPYPALPPVIDTAATPPAADPRFPAMLANGPFRLNGFVSLEQKTPDMIHAFYQEQVQINNGRMDSFVAWSNAASLVMGWFDTSGTRQWRLAGSYALGDRMFHSAFGGSLLNHSFLACSCAFEWKDAPEKIRARLDAEGRLVKDGAVTPDGFVVNTARSVQLHAPADTDPALLVPSQTMPHIGDRLDAKGINWVWYAGGYDAARAGTPDRLFQFHHQPLAYFRNLAPGTPGAQAHLKDGKDLLADIAADRLPPVVFYKPVGALNLHPGYANVADGDAHLADIVARLQASPAWKDMLILVTYDENGGQWDHVAPPRRDRWGPGTRVPLIAIGPTVKRGFVDHTPYDFGSILRTITLRFGAAPVGDADRHAYPMVNLLQ